MENLSQAKMYTLLASASADSYFYIHLYEEVLSQTNKEIGSHFQVLNLPSLEDINIHKLVGAYTR